MNQDQANALEDQYSRLKRKQTFIIFLMIIFFTLMICAIISVLAALKHQIESETPSDNPVEAIQAACKFTLYYDSCIKSTSSLVHNSSHRIHASDVFRLSVEAAFKEFLIVYKIPQVLYSKIKKKNIRPVLARCQDLFDESLNQLNRSLIMITKNDQGLDEEILDYHDEGMMKDLRKLMLQAKKNVDLCLDGLDAGKGTTTRETVEIYNAKERIQLAETYMENSLAILENNVSIREIFDPSVRSMLVLRSILALFVLKENYVVTLVFFSQYLFLVFLVGSFLRVFI